MTPRQLLERLNAIAKDFPDCMDEENVVLHTGPLPIIKGETGRLMD